MYRCRRFLAVLLSLALVASVFVLSVSAEDSSSPFIIVYKRLNSDGSVNNTVYKAPLAESFMTSIGIYGIQITGFEFSPTIFNGLDSIILDFRLSGFIPDEENAWALQWPTGASLGTSDSATKIYCSYAISGRDETPLEYGNTIYYPSNNTAVFQLSYQTYNLSSTTTNRFSISLNSPMTIKPSGANAGRAFWPYISDIHVQIGNGLANQFYLNSISFNGSVSGALFGVYAWQEISYNSNDNSLVTTSKSGNFFQAVLGLLQSMNADAQAQAAQQEKAKDNGAMDALDNAYDHSSFWDLLHFTDFSDFGDYDDDSMSDLGSDSWFDWFSGSTRDDLDTVSRNRDYNDNFISFYDSHMNLIEDKLSGMMGGDE